MLNPGQLFCIANGLLGGASPEAITQFVVENGPEIYFGKEEIRARLEKNEKILEVLIAKKKQLASELSKPSHQQPTDAEVAEMRAEIKLLEKMLEVPVVRSTIEHFSNMILVIEGVYDALDEE